MKATRKPSNWASGLPPLAVFGLLLCIGAVVYFGVETAAAVERGSLVAALSAGALTVSFAGALGAVAATLLVSAKSRSDWSSAGTTVRVHPVVLWLYAVTLLGGAISSSLYLWYAWRGTDDLPFTGSGDGRVARYLMVALLVLSVSGLIAIVRTREPGYMRLNANGIVHGDILRTRSARWEDVVDIRDKSDMRTRNPIVFEVKGEKPIVVANADRYGSAGTALYWMVRHYWQQPDARGELVDGRTLERLREGRFEH
jgi:hypothetical protein